MLTDPSSGLSGRLREAAERGDLRGVQSALRDGADVNEAGEVRGHIAH